MRSPFSTGVHSRLSSSLQFQPNQASTFPSRVNRSGLAEGASGGIWRLIAARPSAGLCKVMWQARQGNCPRCAMVSWRGSAWWQLAQDSSEPSSILCLRK